MRLLINGKLKEQKKTDLDTGYFYGYGVFETILVKEGIPVLAQYHLERLNEGLKTIGVHKTIAHEDLGKAISLLQCYNGSVKVNVSEANTIFSIRQVSYTQEQYQAGAKLTISEVLRNPTSPSVYIKSMNYMDNIMEIQRAKEQGYQDALFLNGAGDICETAVANLFFIKDGRLITPSIESGLLNGVIRRWVIEMMPVEERKISKEELGDMDAVFMTNSLLGIMRVSTIEHRVYGDHPLIHELTQAYVTMLRETVDV